LRELQLTEVPKPLKLSAVLFENVVTLDLRGNDLTELDSALCMNMPNVTKLDLRNNRIKSISEHIKAMMKL